MKGFDCATPLSLEKAKEMKAAGMEFVCRYLAPEPCKWKRLTREEAEAITAAGLWIGCVWETSADRALGGTSAGEQDGPRLAQELRSIGVPHGAKVYVAVDADIETNEQFADIGNYFSAIKRCIPDYRLAAYGENDVINDLVEKQICEPGGWQTAAWSRGRKSEYASIYQYRNGEQLNGIEIDLDESYGREGFWNMNGLKPEGPFRDVAQSRWSAKAVAAAVEAGIMNGYPDGTFRPEQALTREEAASLTMEIIHYVKGLMKA